MSMVKINRNPSRAELRWFGLLGGLFFGVVAVMATWRFGAPITARWIAGFGALFAIFYYVAVPLRRSIYIGWQCVFFPVGWVVSHVILLAVFLFVLTPTGLLMRALGNDPMTRRFDRNAATYWLPRGSARSLSSYFREF